MRGYKSGYICKCGGNVKITNLEQHYVCEKCYEDYGCKYDLKIRALKKKGDK